VIEAACASLNSGKHVLFTGPPGCGKSKLAIALAELATTRKPLLVTASPAWTSGDLIGRYLPSRTGQGLTFAPGSFLRAADQERWLVVDEFNRANIDECFGELFSVLANDIVELPFEERLPNEQPGNAERFAPVRIVPAMRAGEAASSEDTYRDYQVSPSFRLIGTMNDADRAKLHQLSFALQRRFDVIRVEAPPWNVVREVISEEKQRLERTLKHSYRFFQRTAQRVMERRLDFEELEKEVLYGLFAADPNERRRGEVCDLVSERVIGLATVRDVMSFVAEGLRGPVGQLGHASVLLPEGVSTHDVAISYVAMALVLSVFPQLEAVEPGRQVAVIRFIVDRFRDVSGNSLPLLRLTTVENGDEPFSVERVRASDAHAVDQDADTWISIPEYMISELTRQFKGSIAEQDLLDIIRREPQPAGDG
jgi:energy-coupling factor transporter ATP-binding protein EcfA2